MNLLHVCIGKSRDTAGVAPQLEPILSFWHVLPKSACIRGLCPNWLGTSPPPPQQETLDSPLTIVE